MHKNTRNCLYSILLGGAVLGGCADMSPRETRLSQERMLGLGLIGAGYGQNSPGSVAVGQAVMGASNAEASGARVEVNNYFNPAPVERQEWSPSELKALEEHYKKIREEHEIAEKAIGAWINETRKKYESCFVCEGASDFNKNGQIEIGETTGYGTSFRRGREIRLILNTWSRNHQHIKATFGDEARLYEPLTLEFKTLESGFPTWMCAEINLPEGIPCGRYETVWYANDARICSSTFTIEP